MILGPLLAIGFWAGVVLLVYYFTERRPAPEARRHLWRGWRPKAGTMFLAGFVLYAAALVGWLLVGLVPALANRFDGLHERLHSIGGAPAIVEVSASRPEPFAVEGSSRISEITLVAGRDSFINFTNRPDENRRFRHNIAIYRDPGFHDVIFRGEVIAPVLIREAADSPDCCLVPADIVYRFAAPQAGEYRFRCDVHPSTMTGTVRVLPSAARLTNPIAEPGPLDIIRRMAEASHGAERGWQVLLDYLFSAVSFALGVFLVRLRPRDRLARLFGLAMVGTATAYNLQSHASLAVWSGFDMLHILFHPISGASYVYALLLFPDGRLIPRWSRPLVRVFYRLGIFVAIMILLGVTGLFGPEFGDHPATFVVSFSLVIPTVGLLAQGWRLRHGTPSPEQRQQSRLLVWALAVAFGTGLVLLGLFGVVFRGAQGAGAYGATFGDPAFRVFQPLFAVIPLALFVGILRYRLWDTDIVINKTILYGALAGFIGAVYVAIVVGIGNALGAEDSPAPTIAATVLVAVAFEPVRERAQRLANRLVYGRRATPYEVMADFSHRIAGALSFDEVLPRTAEAAGRGIGAARARVRLFLEDGAERAVIWPAEAPGGRFDRVVPVVHQGATVGEIAVAKVPGDPVTAGEMALLTALASHAGVALQSVRLTEQLQARLREISKQAREIAASRRRIVSAQDAERRRLEREIRGGVERELSSMRSSLDLIDRTIGRRPVQATTLLDEFSAKANAVQETLRDLARGIYPPLLVDRGLVPALEGQLRKLGIRAQIDGREALGQVRFDQHAEAAVYFCCVEALKNASGHAAGSAVRVRLADEDGWLSFEVSDEGPGFDSRAIPKDSALQGMTDRVEALGGAVQIRSTRGEGTTVAGRVPAQPPIAAAQTSARRSGSNEDLGTNPIAPQSAALDA